MKEYTELEMISFALHFGGEVLKSFHRGEIVETVSDELEVWKTKTGRKITWNHTK